MKRTRQALTRREMLGSSAALAGSALLLGGAKTIADTPAVTTTAPLPPGNRSGATNATLSTTNPKPLPPGQPGKDYMPVITPNNIALPWKVVDGVKVYHLIAEPVFHEFAPGLKAHCWGYNGHVPGPTIEVVEGDRVRIYVTNRLPAPTTAHWHGLLIPNGMDGVSGLTQRPIPPGETFRYEFTLRQHGTYMYHSHHDAMTQEGLGLNGMFIIHPRRGDNEKRGGQIPLTSQVDRDFVILLHEWKIVPGTYRPDPFEMTDFNVLTMNGRCYPGTDPLVVRRNQRVRIRLGNLSAMDHHPIHLHGYQFNVVATDGGDLAPSAYQPETTVLVAVGQTRDIEFVADAPGDWAMHCHMTHHMMNQMGHGFPNMIGMNAQGLDKQVRKLLPGYMTMGQTGMGDMGMGMPMPPNTIPMDGPGPFGPIMGGMYTNLKVREHISDKALAENVDPGWYQHPKGTEVQPATPEQLRHDGITSE